MVSFVEENAPYRTHPHRLYGEKCKDGVCIVTIKPEDDMTYEFSGLKMQCIRKDDIEKELRCMGRKWDLHQGGNANINKQCKNKVFKDDLCKQCLKQKY